MDRCNTSQFGLNIQESGNPLRQERRLPPFLSSAGVARDLVASRLRLWGRAQQVDDGVQIISELINNALIHAPGPEYVVAVDWNAGAVRLEVWDSSPKRPSVLPLDVEEEHGRGMHLVAALAETWGSRLAASGKCVWAILPGTPYDA
jgi:anti-sigma regulatory factor (Ser/Thr protein kinase)